jgi:F-type H+-transporting ATPase subunit delta
LSSQTVARRYASALADVVVEQKEETEVQSELSAWEKMFLTNSLLMEAFTNPTVAYEQKSRLLNDLISRTKVRQTTANFLRVLLKNQRLAELPAVNGKLTQVLDERAGVVTADVTSARPLDGSVKSGLEDKLAVVTKRKVRVRFDTDESLLGGIVTRIGSTIYDGSVRHQLDRLRQEIAG